MAFSGKVNDRIDAVLAKQTIHQRAIANIALHQDMAFFAVHPFQVVWVACIGEQIKIDNVDFFGSAKEVAHEIGTDESGTASDENVFRLVAHCVGMNGPFWLCDTLTHPRPCVCWNIGGSSGTCR